MKRVFMALLALILLLLSACAKSDLPASSKPVPSTTEAIIPIPGDVSPSLEIEGATEKTNGVLQISFDFTRGTTPASNQYAVWIEDSAGTLVKTLYVTNFTVRGGYENRAESIPTWVAKADPAGLPESEIDAISGATPKAGNISYTWDGTDAGGSMAPAGSYTVCVEGTMYWTSSVLYRGEFELCGEAQADILFTSTFTEDEKTNRDMLSNITASYTVAGNQEESEMKSETEKANVLGGLTPTDAFEYMKATPNLVIVEVNAPEWKLSTGFTGAMWIPHTEMAERYDEIPTGIPVMLHCGGGIVSVPAYETLLEKWPDIPELSYIAGRPLVSEYNEWLENQG